jgi:hypothetical protein
MVIISPVYLRKAAISSVALGIRVQCFSKFILIEIGPVDGGNIPFGISPLPD